MIFDNLAKSRRGCRANSDRSASYNVKPIGIAGFRNAGNPFSGIKRFFRNIIFTVAASAVIASMGSPPAFALDATGSGKSAAGPAEEHRGPSLLEERLIREGFVNVRSLDESILVDLKYSRTDNFMGANVYGDFNQAYLRPEAARKLAEANKILRERHPHLRLLVADALRPRSIQHVMWKNVVDTPKQPYVANPFSGSMHNYGGAVDVTIHDLEAGENLDMGTPLDFFGPLAQPRLEAKFLREGKLSEQQVQNRRILRDAMRDAGWQVLEIEWWHFNAFSRDHIRRNYSIIE